MHQAYNSSSKHNNMYAFTMVFHNQHQATMYPKQSINQETNHHLEVSIVQTTLHTNTLQNKPTNFINIKDQTTQSNHYTSRPNINS